MPSISLHSDRLQFTLKFGDTIYCKTPSNTFVPICNFDKHISATQCFVETNDIRINPIPEYFNDNISPCDSNACLTCNSFISDQSFKSNLTGRIYKTQTYEQLTCGSSNVVYAINCIRCGLMYVGETGRSLWSMINGHRAGIIKDGQSLLHKHFRLAGHSLALESTNYDYESAEYRVTAIILDTAQYRLFRPVCSDILSTDAKTHFIKLYFINKGIDAVNLPSILGSKSVIETVPTYFNPISTGGGGVFSTHGPVNGSELHNGTS